MSKFNMGKRRQELRSWWNGDLNDTEILKSYEETLNEIDMLEKRYREHPWNPAKIEQDTKDACFEVIWPLVVEMAGGYLEGKEEGLKRQFKQAIEAAGEDRPILSDSEFNEVQKKRGV